jgi:hypothetical protein
VRGSKQPNGRNAKKVDVGRSHCGNALVGSSWGPRGWAQHGRATSVSGSEQGGALGALPIVAGNACSARNGSWLGDLLGIAGFAMYFLADHLVGDLV